MRQYVLTAGGAAAVLALLVFVRPGSADVVAMASHLSTPPPRTFLVNVRSGTIGGLKLQTPASSYVRMLGIPDFVGELETPKNVEMLWSRTAHPTSGWATATLKSPTSTTVVQMRFAGVFSTTRGDRRGTSLTTFLKHWQRSNPMVTSVRVRSRVVEYNVVLGGVVFAFDKRATLRAVGLVADGKGQALCVIPTACVGARLD
jgi:hypothetical protein